MPNESVTDEQLTALIKATGTAGYAVLAVMKDTVRVEDARSVLTAFARALLAESAVVLPPPAPKLHDLIPPSAHDWLESSSQATPQEWLAGWDACRIFVRMRVDAMLAAASPSPQDVVTRDAQ